MWPVGAEEHVLRPEEIQYGGHAGLVGLAVWAMSTWNERRSVRNSSTVRSVSKVIVMARRWAANGMKPPPWERMKVMFG